MSPTTITAPSAAGAAGAAARFAATAPADVHYAVVDTPIGKVVAARTERGLARLAYEEFNGGLDRVLEQLAVRLSPRILEGPARLDDVRRELDEYFAGRRTAFDLPLDFSYVKTPFGRRILEACATIPFGEVSSYRAMATKAGSAAAVRAAGTALGNNPIPIVVPCHRVLRTGGGLGGYTGGVERKETLLRIEGALL
ncbi:MAG: methylated-DNA--[protein]-cysteine S-methyltransferase [Solirubrobacteraceae bacterium]